MDGSGVTVMSNDNISRKLILDSLGVFNDRKNGNEHFLMGIDTAKEIVMNAPAVKMSVKWNDPNELLPIMRKPVLIFMCGEFHVAYYDIYPDGEDMWWLEESSIRGKDIESIVAWAELPDPPEGETLYEG